MTQTASFKDKLRTGWTVFKWELRNCQSPLLVYCILAGVATVITLLLSLTFGFIAATDGDTFNYDALLTAIQVFQLVSAHIAFYLNAVFTVIYTIKIYSYLHNKRKADMYGSLPISRRTFYVSKTISAFVISVVPTMFFFGVISIISLCFGQMVLTETAHIYLQLLLGSIACISFYGLLAICCGTTVNTVLSFVAINFAYPVAMLFVRSVIKSFLYGIPTDLFNRSFVIKALNPLAAYDGKSIIYWLLFTVACIALGTFLVKKRKAESAQTSFAYFLPCHAVKLLISFIIGMFFGILLGSLNVFGSMTKADTGFISFFMGFLIGSVPAYLITHLILYKGLKNLIRSAVPFACMVGVVTVAMALLSFDAIGYMSYVPDKSEIASAGLIDMNECYQYGKESTGRLMKEVSDDYTGSETENVIKFHQSVVDYTGGKQYRKYGAVWSNLITSGISEMYFREGYCVAYRLQNGRLVYRIYDTPDTYDMFGSINGENRTPVVRSYATEITDSFEYYKNYSSVAQAKLSDIASIGVGYGDSYYSYISSSDISAYIRANERVDRKKANEDIAKVMEAYRKDLESRDDFADDSEAVCRCFVKTSYSDENFSGNSFLSMIMALDYGYENYSDFDTFFVTEDDKNTISVLREIGVLNSDNSINTKSDYKK